jgi:hypothetical protein
VEVFISLVLNDFNAVASLALSAAMARSSMARASSAVANCSAPSAAMLPSNADTVTQVRKFPIMTSRQLQLNSRTKGEW